VKLPRPLVAALIAVASCRGGSGSGTLLVGGSTVFTAYLEPVVGAFQRKHPKVTVVSGTGDSSAALVALDRGAIDVAVLSREVAAGEDQAGLRDYLVAREAVAVVVHPKNPVLNLSVAELTQICSGDLVAWKDVGGGEGNIALVDRRKDSLSHRSLVDIVLGGDDSLRAARVVASDLEMAEAVNADPLALGFFPPGALPKDMKTLSIGSVPVSRATILSGRYPLSRSFYLAVHDKRSKPAEELVELALGKEGQGLLEAEGLLGVR
jgi:phosphate transport system substrate-binding protein